MESQTTHHQTVQVVHQVECDCRASALRGTQYIESIEEYSASHPELTLVIRRYNCEAFHDSVHDIFQRKEPPFLNPSIPHDIPHDLLIYFEVLDEDSAPATSTSSKDVIHISASLRQRFERLAIQKPESFAEWETNMKPPYLQIYHHRRLIRSLATQSAEDVDNVHLLGLMGYIEDTFGGDYKEADDLFSQGMVTKKHIHKLFAANDVVVCFEEGEPVGFMPLKYPKPGHWPLMIRGFTWVYDGQFRKEWREFDVKWPSDQHGPLDVADLCIYPLRLTSAKSVKNDLERRGKIFWKCRTRGFVASIAPLGAFGIRVTNPRYMIDMETYKQLHQEEETSTKGSKGIAEDILSEELMSRDEAPDENFVLMLPSTIVGFGMHDKKWRTINVKHLDHIKWNEGAFSQLVLDPNKKELIKAMVTSHMAYDKSTDVIEGKGNGLIILLYGSPGTGKTLTAESVAELARKPLYRITCGDIGTEPQSAEEYLDSAFYIATRWNAVVLLDESDVFLEQRQETDLDRNALVSVFLRALEYYEGILILTSNRVNTFDEAFRSRMQLALYYLPIDERGRLDVWNNFISMIDDQQRELDARTCAPKDLVNTAELRRKASVLAKEKLNGREIRNAITTARQLARFRGQAMEYDHIKLTIGVAKEFEENRE